MKMKGQVTPRWEFVGFVKLDSVHYVGNFYNYASVIATLDCLIPALHRVKETPSHVIKLKDSFKSPYH